MQRPGRTVVSLLFVAFLFVFVFVPNLAATPPVPVEAVTGCVKEGQMLIQAPERFKRERPLKISPCTNILFDFQRFEGKQIRATGGIDLYNGAFVCPRDVAVIGDCAPGLCNPEWPCDSTPCGKANSESVRVPPDFEITYASGPLHADWGGGVTITAKANGRVEEKEQLPPAQRGARPGEKVTTYTISQDEVRRIYAQVTACRFFDLKDRYWNQKIRDGGSQSLRVTAGGRTNAATTYYYIVERFNRIAVLFQEICRPAREASIKEKSTRPRMLVEEEAEEIVWNLPEVKALAARMKGTNANPFSMITGYPDPEAKPGDNSAAYEFYVGENHGTHTVRAITFIVDGYSGKVSVYDVVADRLIPIEEYRKQVKK
jgi:hypothetical protein